MLGSCRLERKTVAFSCQRQLQQPDIQSALAHGHFCPWQLAYGRNLPRAVCSTPNFPTYSFSSHPSLWKDELHSICRTMILYAAVIDSSFSEVLISSDYAYPGMPLIKYFFLCNIWKDSIAINKHCQTHNGPKALSTLTHSIPLV